MKALAALAVAILCAVSPTPASAQGREAAYVVSGVTVDATAADAAQAQAQALAAAQRQAYARLVRRVTLPADAARAPQVTPAQLEGLVASVDVNDERRSSTRYIGRVTVRFEANSVRTLLRGAGINVIDARNSPMLVVPQGPEANVSMWREVWTQGGFAQELAPLAIATAPIDGAPSWDAASAQAGAAAAATALYATLGVSGQTVSAALIEVGPNGLRRDRGTVQARVEAAGDDGLRAALASLAAQASDRIQAEWKTRAAAGAAGRARISASALYDTQAQWEQIKDGLEGSAATLISEIRIEAVARNGALVSFSFIGEEVQLAAELRRHGVTLETADIGPVLRAAAR